MTCSLKKKQPLNYRLQLISEAHESFFFTQSQTYDQKEQIIANLS